MAHVFISYKREDKEFALELKQQLLDGGFEIWIDENIRPGRKWRDEIEAKIRESFVVVLIITPEALRSEYVTYEWIFGLGADKEVIPVYLHTVEKLPYRLEDIQYIDFRERHPWGQLFSQLRKVETEYNFNANLPNLDQSGYPSQDTELLADLQSDDDQLRFSAAKIAGQLGKSEAIPQLLSLLHDKNVAVQIAASEALSKLDPTPSLPKLMKLAYSDRDNNARKLAIETLGRMRVKSTAEGLVEILKNDLDTEIRVAAAKALTLIDHHDATSGLAAAMHDADDRVRLEATWALVDRSHDHKDVIKRLIDYTVTIVAPPAFRRALSDKQAEIRGVAAMGLGTLEDKASIPNLVKALEDVDSGVRAAAAWALGCISHPTTVSNLKVLLFDTSDSKGFDGSRVCDVAAEALERIGTPEALAAVEQWRRDQGGQQA